MKSQGIILHVEQRCRHLPIKSISPQSYYFLAIGNNELSIKQGDTLSIGQPITTDNGTNIFQHSPVDGVFEEIQHFYGQDHVVIRANEIQDWPDYILHDPFVKEPDILIDEVRKAGIIGMGGAGFPTHLKLKSAKNNVHTVLINAVECEPFLSSDVSLMFENALQIIQGARISAYIVGAERIVVAIHKNVELRRHLEKYIDSTVQLIEVDTIYPSGFEKLLIQQITGQELNYRQLPSVAGIIIHNVATTFALYEALFYHKPLIERTLTIDGALANEFGNFRVPIGTPISAFMRPFADFDACIAINGGPMMGRSLENTKSTTKNMNGILIFEGTIADSEVDCIGCAACASYCPMRLEPFRLINMIRFDEFSIVSEYGLYECIGCNVCSFVCPSHIPLGSTIFQGKKTLMSQQK
ncbi:MAG: RnfABCDGE type electron transport complex subunit C [Brevinema sp.]